MKTNSPIIKSAKIVVFASGVLALLTACNLNEKNLEENAPKAPIVQTIDRQPFIVPKKTEIVMKEYFETVSNPKIIVKRSIKKQSQSQGNVRSLKSGISSEQMIR